MDGFGSDAELPSQAMYWYVNESDSDSPTPEPSSKSRITKDSPEYKKTFRRAHSNTEAFDDCTKLQGPSNYNQWLRDFETGSLISGFDRLLSGEWKAQAKPDEGTVSNRKWNRYMLEEAYWMGRNKCLIGYIRATLVSHRRGIIPKDCELASDAMKAVEDSNPPIPVGLALITYNKLYDWTFDQVISFEDFCGEFEKRFFAFNDLRGGYELDDNNMCMIFLRALGPDFREWLALTGMLFTVSEFGARADGTRVEMGYGQLKQQAANAWVSISEKNERMYAENRRRAVLEIQQRKQRKRQRRAQRLNEQRRNAQQIASNVAEPQPQPQFTFERIDNITYLPSPPGARWRI